MASWQEVEREAPELAARARGMFDASVHKTRATIRRDGSPRISGTEVTFRAGELWLGSMARAVKALDLRRDPRFALHSASADPPGWTGDAKLAGRALEVSDPAVIARINGAQHTGLARNKLPLLFSAFQLRPLQHRLHDGAITRGLAV